MTARCPPSTATRTHPPPVLEAEVACDRGTQTSPGQSQDQSTQVLFVRACVRTVSDQSVQALPPQLQAEGFTQTMPTWTRDKVTQVPQVVTRDSATGMQQTTVTVNFTQMSQVCFRDNKTSMTSETYKTIPTQTKVYFDNAEILPGAPRLTLPWGYGY